jgi:hypothetical protein
MGLPIGSTRLSGPMQLKPLRAASEHARGEEGDAREATGTVTGPPREDKNMAPFVRIRKAERGWLVKIDRGFYTKTLGPFRCLWVAKFVAWIHDGFD